MSDRAPKVTLKQVDDKWVAYCEEHLCTWAHRPDEKTYVQQRARAHRQEHRQAARG